MNKELTRGRGGGLKTIDGKEPYARPRQVNGRTVWRTNLAPLAMCGFLQHRRKRQAERTLSEKRKPIEEAKQRMAAKMRQRLEARLARLQAERRHAPARDFSRRRPKQQPALEGRRPQ